MNPLAEEMASYLGSASLTDEEFLETLEFAKKVNFAKIHISPYLSKLSFLLGKVYLIFMLRCRSSTILCGGETGHSGLISFSDGNCLNPSP